MEARRAKIKQVLHKREGRDAILDRGQRPLIKLRCGAVETIIIKIIFHYN